MRSVVGGLWFGLGGLLCAYLVFSSARGSGWDAMIYASSLGAFLTGALLWWALMERTRRTSVWKGALTGGLIGLLAHPLAWYIGGLINYFSGTRSSLGDEPLGPLEGLWGALVFSLWSWLLAGWLTVPVGGLLGALLARALRTRPTLPSR